MSVSVDGGHTPVVACPCCRVRQGAAGRPQLDAPTLTSEVIEPRQTKSSLRLMETTKDLVRHDVPSRDFGSLLRHWRQIRRLSQLELAAEAAVSARHLCFLETGRSQPSREMV